MPGSLHAGREGSGRITCLSNVALSMPESPNDGVNDQFELVWGHGEEGVEAVVGDGSQQTIEMQPVLRMLLNVTQHQCSPHCLWLLYDSMAVLFVLAARLIAQLTETCVSQGRI